MRDRVKRQAYMREYHKRRRAEGRELIDQQKSAPCSKCGHNYPPCVMDFHHRDPATKLFSIHQAAHRGRELLLAEIAKCDLMCANCHRIVTHVSSP